MSSSLGELTPELVLEIASHFIGAREFLPLTHVARSLGSLLHPLMYRAALQEAGVLTMVQKAILLRCSHFLKYVLDKRGNNVNDPGSIKTVPISMAISSGTFDLVVVLLKDQRLDIRKRDLQGGTMVHRVLREYSLFGASGILEILLLIVSNPRFPRNDLDVVDNSNCTALSISAEIGDVGVVELLVQNGARYDGWRGIQALHLSAKGGYGDVVRYLLYLGIDPNSILESKKTALFYAVETSRLGMVSLLLSHGAKQSISLHTSGSIPTLALRKQDLYILGTLLNVAKFEPTAVKFEYIYTALRRESSSLFEVLMKVPGFDLHEVDGSTGDTILHYLITRCKPLPVVGYERLIGFGFNFQQQHPRLGGTPINWAIRERNLNAFRAIISKAPDLNFRDDVTGATVVHDAVHSGDIEILKAVLAAGASAFIKNERTGRVPVHHAVERGSLEMTSLLLCGYPNYSAKETMTGNTPLHIAVINGHDHLVDFLISRGANPDTENIRGETPTMLTEGREFSGEDLELRLKMRHMLLRESENDFCSR